MLDVVQQRSTVQDFFGKFILEIFCVFTFAVFFLLITFKKKHEMKSQNLEAKKKLQ